MVIGPVSRRILVVSLAGFLAASASNGQEEPEVVTDSVDVHIFNVEVVVEDEQGLPVQGLSREDFEIYEDGQRMEIANFFAVDGPPASTIEALPPSETASADDPAGLRLVILVDNMNLRPENRRILFDRLRKQLTARHGPHVEMMLVTMGRSIRTMGAFTNDLERIFYELDLAEKETGLHALLDGERRDFLLRLQRAQVTRYKRPSRGPRPPPLTTAGSLAREEDPEFIAAVQVALSLANSVHILSERRYHKLRSSIETIGSLTDTLSALPGRKALIYLSDGLPRRPAESLIEAWRGKYETWVFQNQEDIRQRSHAPGAFDDFRRVLSAAGAAQLDLGPDLERLEARASANRVAFYPISISGRHSEYSSAEVANVALAGTSGVMLRNAMTTEAQARDSSLLRLAEETGGVAFTGTANFGALLDQVERDFASYYSLGYLRDDIEDTDFRVVEVKVHRQGARVRHASGSRSESWRTRLGSVTHAAALFDRVSNPLGIELAPGDETVSGTRFRLPIMVRVPWDKIRLVPSDGNYNARLTLLVVVKDLDDGGLSEPRRIDIPVRIPDQEILWTIKQPAAYPLELEIERGMKRVVVGARDHLANVDSTVSLDLFVGW